MTNHPLTQSRNHPIHRGGLALLFVLGLGLVLVSTRLGIGLGDDSYAYIQPARSALAGEGLVTSPRYGTLLPVLLTATGLLGIDPQEGFRWLNAALFGLNGVMIALLIRRVSGSLGFALLGAALFTLSESMLEIHSWGMSEPLHLFLTLAAFMCLAIYLERGTWRWLVAAALLAGLSALARFVGWLALPAGALAIVLWQGPNRPPHLKRRLGRRLGAALLFGLVGAALPGLSAIYNMLASGFAFGSRPAVWIQPDPRWFIDALGRWEIWVLPGRVVYGRELLLAACLALVLAGVLGWLKKKHEFGLLELAGRFCASPLPVLLAVFLAFYLGFHVLLMFTDNIIGRSDALNNRYMAPLQAGFWIFIATGLGGLYRVGRRGFRLGVVACSAVLVLLGGFRTLDMARTLNQAGMGYAAERWHHSETVAYLQGHPEIPLVSTGNYGFYFWTGRLPRSIGSFTSLDEMRQYQRDTGAWLVVLYSMPPEMYQVDETALLAGQALVEEFSEAAIYRLDE